MSINMETIVTQLYEDISLTDELTDETAKRLLIWGRRQLETLAATTSDQETFDDKFKQLRRVIKSINRFTARRQEMTYEEQAEYLGKDHKAGTGDWLQPTSWKHQQHYLARQHNFDEQANIYALTQVLEIDTHLLSLL